MKRLAVMAHFDHRGEVAPHARRQVEALASSVDALTVVTTARLGDEARGWLGERSDLIERPNYGYDFFSYKVGMARHDLAEFDEVIVCNDSYIGPLVPYRQIFDTMAGEPVDFWGLTRSDRIGPHLQSFFVAFRPWVVESKVFRRFWDEMAPLSARAQVIRRYEIGLTRELDAAGFGWASYFSETEADRRRARRRVRWWVARRQPHPPSIRHFGRWDEQVDEPYNPSIALADRALERGRLPFVKIDTLRYDPYGLDAGRLLDLCERAFPEEFDGVRAWLQESAKFYPTRPNERLQDVTLPLSLVRPMVRYGHG